jgi:hypothetical protein
MVAVSTSDSSLPIRACWLAWIAVRRADQAELVEQLGLTDVRNITW